MEHIQIPLQPEQINHLDNPATDLAAFLTGLFIPKGDNYNRLAYELQREFKAGGSPEVTGIRFDRVEYDASTNKGNTRIVLDINFTFGCEDVKTEKEGQTSEWTFDVDRAKQVIHFYSSPFAESRSTADEF